MTAEQWRPIAGWEGYYEVSDHGQVRSVDRMIPDRNRRLRGRLLRPNRTSAGYLAVSLSREGEVQARRIHRLVLEAFVGSGDGLDACHEDGDPTNNRLDNLRWDTRSENIKDVVRHGTHHLSARTHCEAGHEFTPENTVPRTGGGRRCRTCRNAESRRRKAEKRAAA
ncbi:hypothetical protein C6V83_00090 [Gordonia iterans]|uniref:HNH endonuclease n=1 Tax=Gordonia iterans TaxID=1004901 RepID=A0A2S0KB61_9ACTN|nr:NUMOD4 motif-containing HNH endonuclease [Gordonia iterans]AVL98916.1 hypothetical protein C6V83_00090 [Gordonia iterans]